MSKMDSNHNGKGKGQGKGRGGPQRVASQIRDAKVDVSSQGQKNRGKKKYSKANVSIVVVETSQSRLPDPFKHKKGEKSDSTLPQKAQGMQ